MHAFCARRLLVGIAYAMLALCLTACADNRTQAEVKQSNEVSDVLLIPSTDTPTPVETTPVPTATPIPTPTASPSPAMPQTITVRFVGDLMVSKPMIESAKLSNGGYSFDNIFDPIRSQLAGADLMIGNLETPIAGEENEGFTGRPRFNAPDEYLTAIKNAGFNVLTNANNHLLDRGVAGALTTIQKIRELGFLHTGSFLSPEDAEQLLITDVRGIKVAILAYSYRSTRKEKPKDAETLRWLPNFNNPEDMADDIRKARTLGADVVLVFTHMGKEGTHEPTRLQREMAQHLVDSGADAAIFCHSHAVQPFDRLIAPDGREIFVAYALGNFLADGAYNMSRSGMILELPITVDPSDGTVSIENVRYLPSYAHQEQDEGFTRFSLYSAGAASVDAALPERTQRLAQMAWDTVVSVAGEAYAKPVASFD